MNENQNQRLSMFRRPDYSLAYSASGQLVPRRMVVNSGQAQMHTFGTEADVKSNMSSNGRNSIDDTRANTSLLYRQNHRKSSVEMDGLHKSGSNRSMLIQEEQHKIVSLMQEKARGYNTSMQVRPNYMEINENNRSSSQRMIPTKGQQTEPREDDYNTTSLPSIKVGYSEIQKSKHSRDMQSKSILRSSGENMRAADSSIRSSTQEPAMNMKRGKRDRSKAVGFGVPTVTINDQASNERVDTTSENSVERKLKLNNSAERIAMKKMEQMSQSDDIDKVHGGLKLGTSKIVDEIMKKKPDQKIMTTQPVEGPGTKKFKVLAQLMGNDLEKQYSKHFSDPKNKIQSIRLRKEFEATYKLKSLSIRQALKPHAFRDESQAMGQLPASPVTRTHNDDDGKNKDSEFSEHVSYQTSSDISDLPDQASKEDDSSQESDEDSIFNKTKANADKKEESKSTSFYKRAQTHMRDKKKPPILPKGMTKKTLYDDQLFNKWFHECFRAAKPTQDQLIEKQLRRNLKRARREREKAEIQKNMVQVESEDEHSFSASHRTSNIVESSSSSETSTDSEDRIKLKKDKKKRQSGNVENAFDKQLLKQQNTSIGVYGLQQERKSLTLTKIESDENLRQPENVQKLIQQVLISDEEFTLNLSEEVREILDFFKVTIQGTNDKRKAKRERLTNYFMHQFLKFIKLEKEWAHDIKNNDLGLSGKQIIEAKLARKEKQLIKEVQAMGQGKMLDLDKRYAKNIFFKLLDQEQEQVEEDLLNAKGIALQELLQTKGLSKEMKDFLNEQQPQKSLVDVKLQPHQRDSLSPQRKFISSSFGQQIVAELKLSKQQKESIIQNQKRRTGFGIKGVGLQTLGMIRSANVLQKLAASKSLLESMSFAERPNSRQPTPKNGGRVSIDAGAARKMNDALIKKKLEVSEDLEIFQKSKLQQEYYQSLRLKQNHKNDRDALINNEYSNFCIKEERVQDLPIFTRIKDNALSLTGYSLNSGVCKALGAYLAESNWRIDKTFLLKQIVLDNNGITDNDFAEILSGICVQGQLNMFTYARNEFGIESVNQIENIINQQQADGVVPWLQLNQIRLLKVKTSPEILTHLFTTCFVMMPQLTQLKLQGIQLGSDGVIRELMIGLENHKTKLELLDLQDTSLTYSQLEKLTEDLKEFKEIHTLDLSHNSVRECGDQLVKNLIVILTAKSKLNHLSLSHMTLGFKACTAITQAAALSKSLCALHLSGNKLSMVQQKFMLRILGIRESEMDTVKNVNDRINNDEIRNLIKGDVAPRRSSTIMSHRSGDSQASDRRKKFSQRSRGVGDASVPVSGIIQKEQVDKGLEYYKLYDEIDHKSFPVEKIVNSQTSKEVSQRIAKMKSQQDAQSGERAAQDNLVFTRQIYNPELFFNQDTNREDIQHSHSGPFSWHVNFKTDGCYICQQWRYCVLFFSRKQVMESEFFTPMEMADTRVKLDKICGFNSTDQHQQDQPWLIGSFTALSKSQFVPIAEFKDILQKRLEKSKYLKLSQKVQNSIGGYLSGMFGGVGKNGDVKAPSEMGSLGAIMAQSKAKKALDLALTTAMAPQPQPVKEESKPFALRRKVTKLKTMASFKKDLVLSKSSVHHDEDSSDKEVDDTSNLLDLMQKLKKVDPECLFLNYSSADNPDLESNASDMDQVSDVDLESQDDLQKLRQDFYVFAAYVPPGKHMLLLRDVGTAKHKKYQNNQPVMVQGTNRLTLQSQTSSISQFSQDDSSKLRIKSNLKYDSKKTLSKNQQFLQAMNNTPGESSTPFLQRQGRVNEKISEYYYKDLLVEPRNNTVLKTHSRPFEKADVMGISSQKIEVAKLHKDPQSVKFKDESQKQGSVFRDWIDENDDLRKEFFDATIISQLKIEKLAPKVEPTTYSRFKGSNKIAVDPVPSPFAELEDQQRVLGAIIWDNFMEVREFYYEMAAIDKYSYPYVNLNALSALCLRSGKGYLKATIKVEEQKDEGNQYQTVQSQKINAKLTKKASEEKNKRRSTINGSTHALVEKEKKVKEWVPPQELFSVDIVKPVAKCIVGPKSNILVQGEWIRNQSSTLQVELVGFIAHLLKIAVIWSRANPDGLASVPQIFSKMLREDMPKLRRTICITHKQVQQMYHKVELPYELPQFDDDQLSNLRPILAHQYRHDTLFQDNNVDKILKVYQPVMMSLFMKVCTKATSSFEFDGCEIVLNSLSLASFRLPKSKPTRKVQLKNLVKAALAAAETIAANGGAVPVAQQPVLTIEAIQLCFTKAKMLGNEESRKMNRNVKVEEGSKPEKKFDGQSALAIPFSRKNTIDILSKDEATGAPVHRQASPIQYKRLSFVEWLDFLCRLASCVHVIDSKVAGKTKNASMLRLIEDSKKPFYMQLASFLSVFLKQLLINYAKGIKKTALGEEEVELQDILEQIPDLDDILESMDEV